MKKRHKSTDESSQFCGTTHTARLLGLSVGTVQKLVETKTLQAWKTHGGHRRISMKSISAYLNANQGAAEQTSEMNGKKPQILIVEDDENTRKMYDAFFDKWEIPLEVLSYGSAVEVLIDFHALTPDLLITDLRMPNMSGFEFIKTIQKNKSSYDLPILVVTGLTDQEIQEKGGLDSDILILKKPLDLVWFKGFLQGYLSLKT